MSNQNFQTWKAQNRTKRLRATYGLHPRTRPARRIMQYLDVTLFLALCFSLYSASFIFSRHQTFNTPFHKPQSVGLTSWPASRNGKNLLEKRGGEIIAYSLYSNEVPATPSPTFDQMPVTNLTAVAGSNQVTLNWAALAGATAYYVERKLGAGAYQVIATLGNVTAYVDNAANTPGIGGGPPVNGNTYTYRVRASQP
jgi:hypothetical protein